MNPLHTSPVVIAVIGLLGMFGVFIATSGAWMLVAWQYDNQSFIRSLVATCFGGLVILLYLIWLVSFLICRKRQRDSEEQIDLVE
jgi:hypothetical protein